MTKLVRVPSKTFVFGEYSALVGGPALLVTTEPYFEFKLKLRDKRKTTQPYVLHPDSPAGLYLSRLKQDSVWDIESLKFDYPHGGLGQSSAEFLAVYRTNKAELVKPYQILEDYLSLFSSERDATPSGYDLVSQAAEGFIALAMETKELSTLENWPFSKISFLVIATGNKLKTHEHLSQKNIQMKGEALRTRAWDCYLAWTKRDEVAFIDSIKNFRHSLLSIGLEHPQTTRLIERFEFMRGFLAAKGCGAMGQDFFILLFESSVKGSFVEGVRRCSDIELLCDETRLRV